MSVEEGSKVLREKAFQTYSEAARDLQSRLEQAEARVVQSDGNTSEQQAALEELKKLQTERAEKLKQITAKVQAQINALEFLKKN